MGSWPNRASRSSFGETLENVYPVTNPKKEIGAPTFNMNFWAVGGLCRTGCKAAILATVSGGVVTVNYFGFAASPDGTVSAIPFTRMGDGCYFFQFADQYPDETGIARSLGLSHGIVTPANGVSSRGSHTGSDNASVLTDSSKTWTVNEHVGKYIYNLADGSRALISANTATTVTGSLSGGSGNDWDTGDAYYIVSAPGLTGHVNLFNSYSGDVMFFDSNGQLADPPGFALALW